MPHPAFQDILGHELILDVLSHALDHPAHAYLFSGPEGVGKRTVAECFSRLLLDINATSGGPASLEAHPDFIRAIREEGTKEFSVKRARELISRMQLTAARGGRKVAFLDEAERVNTEAANALLKAVEEPSGQTVYFFITSLPDRLPATLRSRLTHIPFNRLPVAQIKEWLIKSGAETGEAEAAAKRSRGIPAEAKKYLEDPERALSRERQAAALFEAMTSRPLGYALAALESVTKSIESEEDVEAAWRSHIGQWMELCNARFASDPKGTARFAEGLTHAWRFAGSALSPRLALEWTALSPYLVEHQTIDAFFRPRYL